MLDAPSAGSSSYSETSKEAPLHPLPADQYYAVEFPGGVQDASVNRAIEHLGGQQAVARTFRRNAPKVETLLELSWRPGNPYAHPIPGGVVQANNILMKVTKRRRKRRNGEELADPEGEFVTEAVGVIPKTVRFRSMADFQYEPDMSDPVVELRAAMDRMDVETLRKYMIPPEKEDYELPLNDSDGPGPSEAKFRSNLRLIPPPIFSRQSVPQIYNYKANTMSVLTTYIDNETGEEKKRFINRSKWKGYGPACISYSEKTAGTLDKPHTQATDLHDSLLIKVPTEPLEGVKKAVETLDERILDLVKEKFNERPCWTKVALLNQLSAKDARVLTNSKHLLPLVCYVFVDGPWRDTLLKLGFDPRKDPTSRFYQRLYFRNLNHPIVRPSVLARRQDQRPLEKQPATSPLIQQIEEHNAIPASSELPSHIFDGIHLTKETAAYQLCDITDPMIKEMVEDEDGIRDEPNERDGWYTTHALEGIKTVLRYKFFSLLEGSIATDEDCQALLKTSVESRSGRKHAFQARKHNMAKGALPPEDVAAVRLRATLDNASRANRGRK